MATGEPPTWSLIKKSARSGYAVFGMTWRKHREKSSRLDFLPGSLIGWHSENEADLGARCQTKFAWRHRPHAASRPLFEIDFPRCKYFLDRKHRVDAASGGECRP